MATITRRRRSRRLPASWRGYGHRLRITRLTLGVTEAEAASALKVTVRTYRRWEGLRWPPQRCLSAVLAFAAAYDVNIDWLIRGDPGGLGSHLSKRSAGKVVLFCPRGKAWSGPFSPQALRAVEAAQTQEKPKG